MEEVNLFLAELMRLNIKPVTVAFNQKSSKGIKP